jgi:hypothetical protein
MCGFAEAAFELAPILESLDAKHGLFAVLGNYRREPGLHQPRDRHGRPSFPVQLSARSDGDYACARRTVWLESEYMLVETGPLRSTRNIGGH